MWPPLDDLDAETLAAEAAIGQLYREAFGRWVPAARAAVLPTLGLTASTDSTASTDDEQQSPPPRQLPVNVAALQSESGDEWNKVTDTVILAGILLLWAAAVRRARQQLDTAEPEATPAGPVDLSSLPEFDPKVLAIVSRAVGDMNQHDLREAAAIVDQTHALTGARDEVLAAQRADAEAVFGAVQKKVELAATSTPTIEADPVVFHSEVPSSAPVVSPGEAISPPVVPAPETHAPSPEQLAVAQRAAVSDLLEPTSTELAAIADYQGQATGAGIMNHAVLTAAVEKNAEFGEQLDKTWLCVHPDTIVSAFRVSHLARRHFKGALYSIRTASGTTVALTPQHRVLTRRGWVEAQALDLGDDLFHVSIADAAVAPHVEDLPATISQVVDAAMASEPVKVRTMQGGVDLHSDAGCGYVDVVATTGDLSINAESSAAQAIRDLFLTDADRLGHAAVLSHGALDHGSRGLDSTAVLVGDLPVELGFNVVRDLGCAHDAGRGFIADLNAHSDQNGSDLGSAAGVAVADCLCGLPAEVRLNDDIGRFDQVSAAPSLDGELLGSTHLGQVVGVLRPDLSGFARGSDDAAVAQSAADGFRTATQLVRDSNRGMPSQVSTDDFFDVEFDALGSFLLDRVVGIDRIAHDGYVYDLSTISHSYLANGLIAHNCTLDGKTRPTHWAADGQRVPIDGVFTIGGAPMAYPGDQAAPIEQWINCRCRLGILARDEKLPDELDRHTERLDGRDSVVVNRDQRTQAEEIERRRRAGNTRARDNADGIGTVASVAAGQETDMTTATETDETFLTFTDQLFAVAGVPTSDNRMLASDLELAMRDCPMPLQWQEMTDDGHKRSVTVGVIESISFTNGEIRASGYMLNNDNAMKAIDLITHGVNNPSIDMIAEEVLAYDDGTEVTEDNFDGDRPMYKTLRRGELLAATIVAIPAFGQTRISLNTEREARPTALAVVASFSGPVVQTYDASLFEDPKFDRPCAPTMNTETGRIYGHLAEWGHKIRGGTENVPRNHSGYQNFHTSQVQLTDGRQLSVGRLTVKGGHAPTRIGVTAAAARAHYDDVCTAFGLVRVGEDRFGIWFSGVPFPGVDQETFQMGMVSQMSGDWRDCPGFGRDMIAAHAVNSPGFPIYSAVTGPGGAPLALVASFEPVGGSGAVTLEQVKQAIREERAEHELAGRRTAVLAAARDLVGELPPEPTPTEKVAELLAMNDLTQAFDVSRMPAGFKKYWLHGAGSATIGWGKPGDFNRCRKAINAKIAEHGKKPLGDHEISGLCASLHKEATGATPGHAPGESHHAAAASIGPTEQVLELLAALPKA